MEKKEVFQGPEAMAEMQDLLAEANRMALLLYGASERYAFRGKAYGDEALEGCPGNLSAQISMESRQIEWVAFHQWLDFAIRSHLVSYTRPWLLVAREKVCELRRGVDKTMVDIANSFSWNCPPQPLLPLVVVAKGGDSE